MTDALQFLSKTVNAWDTIPPAHKMLMLIGYSYTGRSTFAELIKKYQFREDEGKLIFEKDKYILQNVISSKSIKIQTTLPALYRVESSIKDVKDHLSIIDVPAYSLAPQTKKWTTYEQKLTWTLMSQKQTEIGFLLFIQQKNTRSNISSWTKTLVSFLDMYKEYPNQLLNSVGWVITKCPPDVTEDAISKRLQQMQNALKKEKNLDGDMIDRLFGSVLQNKRYFIVKKCTGTPAEEEEIKNIYRELSKVANYQFKKEHLKEITWSAEEKNLFAQYVDNANNQFTSLFNYVNECLLLQRWDKENIVFKRKDHLKYFDKDEPVPWTSRFLQQKFDKKLEEFDLVALIKAVGELMKFYESNSKQSLEEQKKEKKEGKIKQLKTSQILGILADFPFFFAQQQIENEYFFQLVYETFHFKHYINNKDSLNDEPLYYFCEKLVLTFCQRLTNIQTQNDNEPFYEACIDLLDNVQRLKHKFARFLEDCKSNILKFRNSKQLLEKIVKDLENTKDQKKIFELILKAANTLQKEGYLREAGKYYMLILCPDDAIACLERVQNESEEEARQLIDYLTEHCLFETAKRSCYMKASKFPKSRAYFGKHLNSVIEAQRKYMQSGSARNVLLEEVQVPSKEIEGLRKEVSAISTKLKI